MKHWKSSKNVQWTHWLPHNKNLPINWRKDEKKKDCPCFLDEKFGYTEVKSKTLRIRSQKSGSKQTQNYGISKSRKEDTKPLGSGQIPTLKHSTREPRLKRCFEFLVQLICVNSQCLSQSETINLNVSVWWFLLNTILPLLPTELWLLTILSSACPPKIPSIWARKGKHNLGEEQNKSAAL